MYWTPGCLPRGTATDASCRSTHFRRVPRLRISEATRIPLLLPVCLHGVDITLLLFLFFIFHGYPTRHLFLMRKSFGYSFVRSSLLLIYVTILSVGGCRASNARVVNKIRIEKKVEGSDFKYLGYRISEYKSDLEHTTK